MSVVDGGLAFMTAQAYARSGRNEKHAFDWRVVLLELVCYGPYRRSQNISSISIGGYEEE